MTSLLAADRRTARLLTGLLSLVAAATLLLSTAPAEAGSNWYQGRCSSGYNYADTGSGYLYASTTADIHAWPEPCATAAVQIRLGGCGGHVLASAVDYMDGFASTSYSLDSIYWNTPRSTHQADWDGACMLFNY